MEQLIKSYKSIALLFEYLFNDFSNFYDRIIRDYELVPFVAFLIQLTAVIVLANEVLMPIDSDSNSFFLAWFAFGYIQLAISVFIFAIFLHGMLKATSPSFDKSFKGTLKFLTVYYILMQSVTLVFSFASQLYLYVATDSFESMGDPFHLDDGFDSSDAIYIIESYVITSGFVLLLAILLYVSFYRSIWTLVCFLIYGLFYSFLLKPYMNSLWASFMCKRFDILCWNI